MVFPAAHLSLPMEAVPLSAPRHGVAVHATRLPLSPHCNPFFARNDSLGDFHHSPSVSLASFADQVSRSDRGWLLWPERNTALFPHPPAPRKAGYICTQRYGPCRGRCTALQVHILLRTQAGNTTAGVRLCTRAGLHGNRVGITMPLESALSPQACAARFPPAPTRNWAYQAGTTGFIGMPFRGFLGPP